MELLRASNLTKLYRKHRILALDRVSFSIKRGEVFGLVGESGCGKTTLGRAITRLIDIDSGSIIFKGKDIAAVPERALRSERKSFQIIFQDPYSSLDPRLKIGKAIEEAYLIHTRLSSLERKKKVGEMLDTVGLGASYASRLPSELSGGERQRAGIARAIALEPEFIVCDEPVSNLDISIQAQILNLLMELKNRKGLTYLFISHDLSVVYSICDRVAVMREGRFVETGACEKVFNNPETEYTRSLIASLPGIQVS